MRIGIDARSVYPGHGGIGTYVCELVRALVRVDSGNEYVLFSTERKGPTPIALAPNLTETLCPAAMLDRRWEQFELPSLAEALALDVLHMTCFTTPIAKTCPVVATIHDVVFRVRPDLVRPALADYLDRWAGFAAHTADQVITCSHHSCREISRVYGISPQRITVINEAPGPQFRPADRSHAASRVHDRLGLDAGYVLYVGALEPKKNIDGLLDAFAQLLRNGRVPPGMTLALVGGEGGMPYDVDQAVRLRSLGESVRALGYVADEELPFLYRAAGVFVYPSFYEGFGLPPLEAMACGTPTVVSNATSLPEVVGDGALLADPEHPSEIAGAMEKVLLDPAFASALSARGRARAAQFSWEETARSTLQVYQRAAGGTKAAA